MKNNTIVYFAILLMGKMKNLFEKIRNYKIEMSSTQFITYFIFINLILYNFPVLQFTLNNLDYSSFNGIMTMLIVFVIIYLFSFLFLSALFLVLPFLVKPFCALAMLINSIALYFVVTYKIMLDKSMMSNVFNTRESEAVELIHPKLFVYFIFLGILPLLLLYFAQVKKVARLRLTRNAVIITVVSVLVVYLNAESWLWLDKNAKYMGGLIMPWSYIGNSAKVLSKTHSPKAERIFLPAAELQNDDKMVVVLIIGETARLKNFSLYDYERNTNPLLSKQDVVALNATSCSTYTTASLECILSYKGVNDSTYEPLPSYLKRQGLDVIWRSYNWGEPPVDVTTYQRAADLQIDCVGKECHFDGVLLRGLTERIRSSDNQKVFVVLHTKGSHGPSYYSRYPKDFEKYKPVCKTVELDKCTIEELTNAYDNTILYTDYFLTNTIQELKKLKEIPVFMMYVSDHGESLGEFGLYLHGTPMMLSPDVQKKVPFIMWMSQEFKKQKKIDHSQLKQREMYYHKNVFHSTLGAFEMQSEIYDEDQDILNDYR